MAYTETALYCDSVAYTAVPQWAATHAYTVGQIVRQLAAPGANNERCFICLVAGTSVSTEPTWNLGRGAATNETTVHWMECTGLPAVNSDNASTNKWAANAGAIALGWIIQNVAGTFYFICTTAGTGGTGAEPTWNTTAGATTTDGSVTWTCIGAVSSFTTKLAAPHARLTTPLNGAANWLLNAGMNIWVGDDHSETNTGTNYTQAFSCNILCFDHTVTLPPGSANLKITAVISNPGGGGNIAFLIGSVPTYTYGIQFSNSASFTNIQIARNNTRNMLERCTFSISGTNTNTNIFFGDSANTGSPLLVKDCTFSIANFSSGQVFGAYTSNIKFENCTFTATLGTAGQPLFSSSSAYTTVIIEGCDFSGVPNSAFLTNAAMYGVWTFKDCVIPAGLPIMSGLPTQDFLTVDLNRVDSGATIYRNERYRLEGKLTTATSAVRTGGASDGATSISHQIVTNANTDNKMRIFNSVPFAIWNSVIGTNRNVTAYGIANDSRVPNNDEVWFDIEYLGSASSPKGSFARGGKANVLAAGSALTANTSAWTVGDMSAPRGNSFAYSLGAVISVPDNTSCRFFCTQAGTSASSEPSSSTPPTWNSSDLAGGVTLSGGNLTVTSSASDGGVRSIIHNTTGKYYFEGTWTATTGTSSATFGLASTAQALSQTNCLHAVAVQGNGGIVAANTSIGSVGAAMTVGQTTCIAIDLNNQLIWFRTNNGNWNNSGTANPATGTGGIVIPGTTGLSGVANYALFAANVTGFALTVNLGGTAFAYTAPSGFGSWNSAFIGYAVATDGQTVTDGTATFLANNNLTYRRNSFPYQPGNFFMTASNPGRIFFCTSAGISASSEPTGGVGTIYPTWNPSDIQNMTLSGGNLIAQGASTAQNGVRSTFGLTSGKVYFELTVTGTMASTSLGVATSAATFSGIYATGTGASFANPVNGNTFDGSGTAGGNLGAFASGDILCVALDLTNLRTWFRKNNGNWNASGTANPATNTGGLSVSTLFSSSIAAYAVMSSQASSVLVTANFGATSFTYVVPSGFSAFSQSLSQINYSTATDGTSGGDGTATFRAGCRFSQTITLPQAGVTTWNSSDLLNVTLSNGNLTATAPSASPGGVRGNSSVGSGKYYWECTCNATAANEGVGTATGTASLATGGTAAAIMITSGQIYVNGGSVATGTAFTAGSTVCMAIDFTNSLIWFRVGASGNWNGSSSNNPATGVGGVSFSALVKPLYPYLVMTGGNASYTANFGASAFAGAVPSGFTSWNSLVTPLAPAIAQPGYLYAYPKLGRPSMTYYLDPLPVLS